MRKLAAAAILVALLAGCERGSANRKEGGKNIAAEQEAVQTGFSRLTKSQQIPTFSWSQERQTLIDVETLRATGATSTTAGYLEGIGLVWWCPSIGAPVPATFQLSTDSQYVDLPGDDSRTLYAIQQGEPTGVYVGPSTGTWTVCLDDNGRKFGQYWEGYVFSTTGVVSTFDPSKRVAPSDVTFKFTDAKR